MESVIAELVAAGQTPKRSDIARLLATVGAPGKSREAKTKTVVELFNKLGGGRNAQGIHVSDDLPTYEEF